VMYRKCDITPCDVP